MNVDPQLQFIYSPWDNVGNFSIEWLLAANDTWSEHGRDAAFVFLLGA